VHSILIALTALNLAGAPGLGFENQRFQNVAFHFKNDAFYERKTVLRREISLFTIDE
jgi:hypothetical protein